MGLENGFCGRRWGDAPDETLQALPEADISGLDAYHERWNPESNAQREVFGFKTVQQHYFFHRARLVRVRVDFNIPDQPGVSALLERLTKEWGEPRIPEEYVRILKMQPDIQRSKLTSIWTSEDGVTEAELQAADKWPTLLLKDRQNCDAAIESFWKNGRW